MLFALNRMKPIGTSISFPPKRNVYVENDPVVNIVTVARRTKMILPERKNEIYFGL